MKAKYKALLYTTKQKPYLYKSISSNGVYRTYESKLVGKMRDTELNGKIVIECDYEVEWNDTSWCCSDFIEHKGLEKSCLTKEQLFDYVRGRNEFYAIHIKNLHIFDKPKELSEYYGAIPKKMNTLDNLSPYVNVSIDNAPKNMMYAIDDNDKEYIIIPVSPQEMCRIANKEQTVLVRKRVLKEMLK